MSNTAVLSSHINHLDTPVGPHFDPSTNTYNEDSLENKVYALQDRWQFWVQTNDLDYSQIPIASFGTVAEFYDCIGQFWFLQMPGMFPFRGYWQLPQVREVLDNAPNIQSRGRSSSQGHRDTQHTRNNSNKLLQLTSISLFREGIQPKWEDVKNKNHEEIYVNWEPLVNVVADIHRKNQLKKNYTRSYETSKRDEDLNRLFDGENKKINAFWMRCILACIGEVMECQDAINGIRIVCKLNTTTNGEKVTMRITERLEIWLRDPGNSETNTPNDTPLDDEVSDIVEDEEEGRKEEKKKRDELVNELVESVMRDINTIVGKNTEKEEALFQHYHQQRQQQQEDIVLLHDNKTEKHIFDPADTTDMGDFMEYVSISTKQSQQKKYKKDISNHVKRNKIERQQHQQHHTNSITHSTDTTVNHIETKIPTVVVATTTPPSPKYGAHIVDAIMPLRSQRSGSSNDKKTSEKKEETFDWGKSSLHAKLSTQSSPLSSSSSSSFPALSRFSEDSSSHSKHDYDNAFPHTGLRTNLVPTTPSRYHASSNFRGSTRFRGKSGGGGGSRFRDTRALSYRGRF